MILRAEELSKNYLTEEFSKQKKQYDINNFLSIRNRLKAKSPIKYENLSVLRKDVLELACEKLINGTKIANKALNLFLSARQPKNIPREIELMLKQLAKTYTLVSITNGNCNVQELSIARYFSKHYSPQQSYRAKPHPQMLKQVAKDYKISKEKLLHVGDEVKTDGKAAANFGCIFCLFQPFAESNSIEETVSLLSRC